MSYTSKIEQIARTHNRSTYVRPYITIEQNKNSNKNISGIDFGKDFGHKYSNNPD